MANADDSPPSDSGEDSDPSLADDQESPGFSLPDPDIDSEEARESDADDSDGSGFSLPEPSSVVDDDDDDVEDAGGAPDDESTDDDPAPDPDNQTMLGLGDMDRMQSSTLDSGEDGRETEDEPADDGFEVPKTEMITESELPANDESDEDEVSPEDSNDEVERERDPNASSLTDIADEMAETEADSDPFGEGFEDDETIVNDEGFDIDRPDRHGASDGSSGGTIESPAPKATDNEGDDRDDLQEEDGGTLEEQAPHLSERESEPVISSRPDKPVPEKKTPEEPDTPDLPERPEKPNDRELPPEPSTPAPDTASDSGSIPDNPPPPEQEARTSTDPQPDPDPTAEVAQPELEAEADFAEQKTDLFDSPFEDDPLYPRLTILEGPSSGQEFLLNKLRNSVGRGSNNTVTIPDEAMSRQHLEIVQNPDDTYTIKDLQSVNGTFLNGTKIREADLFHGDRVEMGATTFQFGIPGQRTSNEERQRRVVRAPHDRPDDERPEDHPTSAPVGDDSNDDPTTRWLNRIIVGSLLALIPLGATFVYLTLQTRESPEARAQAAQARKARTAYLAGVDAVKQREWQRARTHFQKAGRLDGDLSTRVEDQLQRIEAERAARESLAEARAALDRGDDEQALQRAKSVPRNSVYYEDSREIVRRVERRRRVRTFFQKAQTQVEAGNHQAALATLQRVLGTRPNHEGALALRRRILEKSEADLEKARKKAKREEKERRRRTAARDDDTNEASDHESWLLDNSSGGSNSGDDEEETSPSSTGSRRVNFTKGFALYQQKEFAAAISHFQQAAEQSEGAIGKHAAEAAENIGRFRGDFQAARRALASEDWQSAIEHYRSALDADEKVADATYFSDEIERSLASARAGLGLEHVEKGNYRGAFEAYKKASRHAESSARVRKLRRKLGNRARSLYIQAAAERKTDPERAAELCREITSIVPSSNEYYGKARKILEEL